MSADGLLAPGMQPSSMRSKAALERARSQLSPSQEPFLEAVRAHPGLVVSELARILECSHTNVARHLDRLRHMGLLVREKHGRGVRHYCVLDDVVAPRVAAHCQDPKKRRVLEFLAGQPGKQWIPNEIACQVGVQHAFVQRLIKRLLAQGLVRVEQTNLHHYVRPAPQLVEAMERTVEQSDK